MAVDTKRSLEPTNQQNNPQRNKQGKQTTQNRTTRRTAKQQQQRRRRQHQQQQKQNKRTRTAEIRTCEVKFSTRWRDAVRVQSEYASSPSYSSDVLICINACACAGTRVHEVFFFFLFFFFLKMSTCADNPSGACMHMRFHVNLTRWHCLLVATW